MGDDDIILHALGLPNPRGPYRNYFNSSPGTPDDEACRRLVTQGLMVQRPPESHGCIPGHIYHVTPAGYKHVGAASPTDAAGRAWE